jgi:hypothetical protein
MRTGRLTAVRSHLALLAKDAKAKDFNLIAQQADLLMKTATSGHS